MRSIRMGIAVALILLCCVTGAFAQEGSLVVDHVEKTEDNIMEMSVSIKDNPGLAGLAFYVRYSSDVAEVMHVETVDIGSDFLMAYNEKNTGDLFVVMIRADNATSDGELLRLRFRLYDEEIVDAGFVSLILDTENVINAALETVPLSTSKETK